MPINRGTFSVVTSSGCVDPYQATELAKQGPPRVTWRPSTALVRREGLARSAAREEPKGVLRPDLDKFLRVKEVGVAFEESCARDVHFERVSTGWIEVGASKHVHAGSLETKRESARSAEEVDRCDWA